MNRTHRMSIALAVAFAGSPAWAAPCAGFNDVDSASPFCPSVEWLRNRAITLGCSSTSVYCPNDPVSRLAMAAFMTRLGTALTPVVVKKEMAPGGLNIDGSPVICATDAFAVQAFPRRAYIDAGVSGMAPGTVDLGVTVVKSTNGGASWEVVGAESRGAVWANRWGNVSSIAETSLDVGQSIRFGIRLTRADSGSVDLSDSWCSLNSVIFNRNGSTSPY